MNMFNTQAGIRQPLLLLVAVCVSSHAAELVGLTKDAVSDEGVPAVKVRLQTSDKQQYKNAISDAGGRYKIAEVSAGSYVVVFEKTGFSATPKNAVVTLAKNETRQQDATLYLREPDHAYIVALADRLAARARNTTITSTRYSKDWANIQAAELPLEFEIQLADELQKQDPHAPALVSEQRRREYQLRTALIDDRWKTMRAAQMAQHEQERDRLRLAEALPRQRKLNTFRDVPRGGEALMDFRDRQCGDTKLRGAPRGAETPPQFCDKCGNPVACPPSGGAWPQFCDQCGNRIRPAPVSAK